MARLIGAGAAVLAGSLIVGVGAGPARAQMSTNPAEITSCLCMEQGISTLSADMSAKTRALAAVRQHLADLDSQLAQARPKVNVNNPDSVASYKALLSQRDAAYQQSLGPVVSDADQATARYNAQVSDYNARCANHMFDSAMMAEIQAHLSCPPLR